MTAEQYQVMRRIVALYGSLPGCGDDWQRGLLHLGLIQDAEDNAIALGILQQELNASVNAELKQLEIHVIEECT